MVSSPRACTFTGVGPPAAPVGIRSPRRTRRPMVAPIATVSESSQHASTSDDSDKITAGPHPQVSRPLVPGTWPIFLRTVAVYATQVAYRIFSQPLQPITDRLRARAAASEAVRSACERLQVDDLTGLQDLCNSLILAESVYKCVGRPEAEAARFISALKAAFPGVASVSSAQFARPHVRHRFVVAEGGDAIYVAFMGTKMAKDYLTNAAVWQEEVRLDAALLSEADAEGITGAGAQPGAANGGKMPAAHRGFLSRARAIPIDSLYAEAARRGKRLVLCGHSLGGAVAQLCTIHLLQRLPPSQHDSVACFGFATPALANEALATMVENKGWNSRIRNYLVPEDPIPHLLASPPPPPEAAPPVEPSAEVDTPKSASIPDIFGNMGAPEGAVPPHQMMARAASNITAMPARVLGLGRQTDTASKREGKKDVIVDPLDSPVQGGSPVAVLDSPRDAPELSSDGSCGTDSDTSQKRGRRPFRAAWSAASVPMRMAFGAAQMAATVPMRAAPRYHPLGKQLYVTDCITTERPVGKQMSMRSLQPAPAESMPPALEATTAWDAWVPWLRGIRRNQLSAAISVTASGSLDGGDDDNVDVAAAAAAAGALVPERLPARTIFPMHRMVTYRTRLLAICQDALSGHQWPALAPMLPYLGSIPCPGDVLVTELLAPAMFPLKAEASVANIHHPFKLMAPSSGAEAASDPSISGDESAASGEGTALKAPPTRRRVSWLRRLLFKPALSEDDSPVELVVRVEGKGLSNATAAWVSGATVDSSGKALPAAMEIVSRPAAPAPSAVKSAALPPSPVAGPLFVFLSWVTQAAGWVALLRQLQPAGQSDYLLAKVKLPRGAVQEAALAGVDPLLAAAVGEVAPRLMVHIQSDFAVQSIPLEVGHLKRKGGKVMAGGGVRGGFKDPSVFLRHARVALRRRPQSSSV